MYSLIYIFASYLQRNRCDIFHTLIRGDVTLDPRNAAFGGFYYLKKVNAVAVRFQRKCASIVSLSLCILLENCILVLDAVAFTMQNKKL